MPRLRPILHRLRGFYRRRSLEGELNAELGAHLDALFVRQGMRLVAIGAVAGLAGGAMLALALRNVVVGLSGAFDPIAFGAVTALLGGVALLACWLPARRATKVDPMIALRAE